MLLYIHLFNIGGQLTFYIYRVYKTDLFFNEQINENHYNINDLTTIEIPVNMPNVQDWNGYESLSGKVQFQEASYNYVKIRITHNAIYLVCVPNYSTTHLSDQNVIYAKQIKDIPVPKKDHVPFGKINLIDYSYQTACHKFSDPVIIFRRNNGYNHFIIPNPFVTGRGQPPDFSNLIA